MADADLAPALFDEAVDQYLTRAYDGDRRRTLLDVGGWAPDLTHELAELGWFELAVPEDAGGLGAPLSDLGPLFMQFGRHLMVGPMLELFLLPAMLPEHRDVVETAGAQGRPVALVDPAVTSDWSGDVGAVVLSAGRLDGAVDAVRFAHRSRLLAVAAETGDGAVLCLVDPAGPGVRTIELGSADPATSFARVDFDAVPATAVGGPDAVARIRSWARLLIACELSGLAAGSLERTVEYVVQREQFARPVGSFQAVKHIAADMRVRWAGLHNLCRAALYDARGASGAELDLLAATVKAHAAAAAVRVCEDAVQLHGGIGFTTESDVGWYYRRALALRAWYGDESELQQQIGTILLTPGTVPGGGDARSVRTERST